MAAFKLVCFSVVYFVACAASDAEPEPAMYSTSLEPEGGAGECEGNDSRCKGASADACKTLTKQGTDCKWYGTSGSKTNSMSKGDCKGNDSRCGKSSQPKCLRLKKQGSDCYWDSSFNAAGGADGACAGHDSRCAGATKTSCSRLTSEGSDCKWRKNYQVLGEVTLEVTNAAAFASDPKAQDGVKEGLANVTGVPKDNIEIDVHVVTRRLEGRSLTASSVIITYVISVGADAPATVVATSDSVSQMMSSSNQNAIGTAITAKVTESVGANSFNIAVQSVPAAEVTVFSDTSSSITTTSSANMSSGLEPEPDMVSTSANSVLDDNGSLLLVAHPLLVLFASGFYLL